MYVAVRADLPVGLQMAQTLHAAFGFALEHAHVAADWLRESQYLIVVSVPDEQALLDLTARAGALPRHLWREPDLDGQATAVALAPGPVARRLCANLPLAGRGCRALANS